MPAVTPDGNHGVVNPPVYHCSTVIFPTVETLLETRRDRASGAYVGFTYGREGTPTTRAFEDAITALEGRLPRGRHILRAGRDRRVADRLSESRRSPADRR